MRFKEYGSSGDTDNNITKIAFLGDSRASDWAGYFSKRHGVDVINLGIDGQTTAQVLYRIGYQLADLDIDIIIIQVGINDLKVIGFDRSRTNEIINLCKVNISKLVNLVRKTNAKVVLTTVFPRGDMNFARQFLWNEDVDLAILEINDFIRKEYEERITVVDTYSILRDSDLRVNDAYSLDFFHLNSAGYDAIDADGGFRASLTKDNTFPN